MTGRARLGGRPAISHNTDMTTSPADDLIATRIQKTPGVCGGDARIANHRIPVWGLIVQKKSGLSDADILANYPSLTTDDLAAAWAYYQREPLEIEQLIWLNDTAGNVPPSSPPPASVIISGKQFGLSDADVMEAFDPPLSPADLAAAWQAYLAAPTAMEREIAAVRRAG
jgi:uncharacterized protein (DUF433 family)